MKPKWGPIWPVLAVQDVPGVTTRQTILRETNCDRRPKPFDGSHCHAPAKKSQDTLAPLRVQTRPSSRARLAPNRQIHRPPQRCPCAPEAQVLDRVFNAQIRERVQQEIARIIRSEDFQILHLYYVEKTFIEAESQKRLKWTDRAIGELLGMPLNTVTSRRTRARNQLRKSPLLQELFAQLVDALG